MKKKNTPNKTVYKLKKFFHNIFRLKSYDSLSGKIYNKFE